MMQVNATRFATEKRIFFAVYKARFEEIRETALASVVHEYLKSKTLEGKETSSSSSEDEKFFKNLLLTQLSMWGNLGPRVIATIWWWQVCFQKSISYNAANVIKEAEKIIWSLLSLIVGHYKLQ